ncbi:fimbrial protein [Bacillus sp. B15-48]|uniref:fimbrial protein n=1 Tax=Bacillus sp. B15-48 TaxID=1548601 RepID=UPI00193ED321|nr:fimbrial protein [Bacillus sp. B15-48]MBM4762442.1 fimbrial protein [Bacillus sp. B15-48]
MLVDINLLPKKEPKNYTIIFLLVTTLVLLVIAAFLLFWQGSRYDSEIALLENQITTTQRLIEIEEAKGKGGQASNSASMLQSAVRWASAAPLKTVPIIQQVTSLLPERGFIETISYSEHGSVNVTVQFDTSREAAYYLKNLLDSDWTTEVTLSSVTTRNVETNDPVAANEEEEVPPVEQPPSENLQTIVPRYIGQYQLQLNRSFINRHEQNTAELHEGGEPS